MNMDTPISISPPPRIKIKEHLASRGTTYKWLGQQLGIGNKTIYEILSGRRNITPKMLDRINKVLNTNF
jgi:plasmid maintenance system antidote protein VapI